MLTGNDFHPVRIEPSREASVLLVRGGGD